MHIRNKTKRLEIWRIHVRLIKRHRHGYGWLAFTPQGLRRHGLEEALDQLAKAIEEKT